MSSKRRVFPALALHIGLFFVGSIFLVGSFWIGKVLSATETESLRGDTPLDENPTPPKLKDFPRETNKYQPNYIGQPPLIPHDIRGYEVSSNYNACMGCHSWENARTFKATPVGVSHYKDRDGKMLSDISPDRYNCTQCHVPQKNAPPLRKNLFEPLESVTP